MISNFENINRKVFKYLFPKYNCVYNIRPNWLKFKTGNNLELDIFFPELRLAIEVNGFTHNHNFQIEKDKFKWQQCKRNKIFLLNINSFNDLFDKKVRSIMLKRFNVDIASLSNELIQEISDYRPQKIQGLLNKVIWKAKKYKMIERYKDAQSKEKGYSINSFFNKKSLTI